MESLDKAYTLGLVVFILCGSFFIIGLAFIMASEFKEALMYWINRFFKKQQK